MENHKLLLNVFFALLVVFGPNSVSGDDTITPDEVDDQPLSKIAIEKAVFALRDSASVSVHPLVLGLKVTML